MSKDIIAGFMIGVSFGVLIGYFLKPPAPDDQSAEPAAKDSQMTRATAGRG